MIQGAPYFVPIPQIIHHPLLPYITYQSRATLHRLRAQPVVCGRRVVTPRMSIKRANKTVPLHASQQPPVRVRKPGTQQSHESDSNSASVCELVQTVRITVHHVRFIAHRVEIGAAATLREAGEAWCAWWSHDK